MNKRIVMFFLIFLVASLGLWAAGSGDPGTTGSGSGVAVQWADGETKELAYRNLTSELVLPIYEEMTSMRIAIPAKGNPKPDLDDHRNIGEIRTQTNIDPEWIMVDRYSWEKFEPSLFASGEALPDIVELWNPNLRWRYAQGGLIIPLDELIWEHAPDLKNLFNMRPFDRKMNTFPDGKMYSIPRLQGPGGTIMSFLINPQYMAKLNLTMPKDMDDFNDMVQKMINGDPNGNGEKDEVYTYGDRGNWKFWLEMQCHIFGMRMSSVDRYQLAEVDFTEDPDGKIVYKWRAPQMYDLLVEAKRQYEEGWIPQQMIDDPDGFVANAQKPERMVWFNWLGASETSTPILPFKGYYGNIVSADLVPSYVPERAYVITKDCKDPAAAIKWLDYITANRDGNLMWTKGFEGVDYMWRKGLDGVDYINMPGFDPEVTWDPAALELKAAEPIYFDHRSGGAQIEVYGADFRLLSDRQENFKLGRLAWEQMKDTARVRLAFPVLTVPEFGLTQNFTASTEWVLDSLRKFINGEEPLENWDLYIDQLKKFGVEDLEKAYQMAFDRLETF